MEKTCPHCKKKFIPHPAVSNQRYCGSADCQRARKRKWQKEKLTHDPDYRENQAAAQRAWCDRNRDYWREYRKRNKTYSEQNRLRQRERNRRRRMIAKMDELRSENDHILGALPARPSLREDCKDGRAHRGNRRYYKGIRCRVSDCKEMTCFSYVLRPVIIPSMDAPIEDIAIAKMGERYGAFGS